MRRIIGTRETRRYPDTFGWPTNVSVAKLCEGYRKIPRSQGLWEKMQFFFFGLRASESQEERRVGRGRGGGGGHEEKEEGRRRGGGSNSYCQQTHL